MPPRAASTTTAIARNGEEVFWNFSTPEDSVFRAGSCHSPDGVCWSFMGPSCSILALQTKAELKPASGVPLVQNHKYLNWNELDGKPGSREAANMDKISCVEKIFQSRRAADHAAAS